MKVWLQLIRHKTLLCKFFEVFLWTAVREKFWSFQNLSFTILDSFRKNFDYYKLRYRQYSCIREYSTATCFLVSCIPFIVYKKCVTTGNWKNTLFQKHVLNTRIIQKNDFYEQPNTEFQDFFAMKMAEVFWDVIC